MDDEEEDDCIYIYYDYGPNYGSCFYHVPVMFFIQIAHSDFLKFVPILFYTYDVSEVASPKREPKHPARVASVKMYQLDEATNGIPNHFQA